MTTPMRIPVPTRRWSQTLTWLLLRTIGTAGGILLLLVTAAAVMPR